MIERLRKTGTCFLDELVTSLPQLSWGDVFTAVNRMSRNGLLLVRQVSYSTYQITLLTQSSPPLSHYRQTEARP
ncbi:MAG TPA: hypothetical protein VIW47_10335 [Nitrospiraceae bacterium]